MSKKIKFILWIVVAVVTVIAIAILGTRFIQSKTVDTVHPIVTFDIENYGKVKAELYPEYAPTTVTNIVALVKSGYYENKVIYGKDAICLYLGRDKDGNVADPTVNLIDPNVAADSEENFEYTIPGEFNANGYKDNTLRHEKGVLSLIRNDYTQSITGLYQESYNSGNSQIGVMIGDESSNLNGVYAAFGRVIEGLDILETIYDKNEIAEPEKNEDGTVQKSPIEKFKFTPIIKSATVDTFGVEFGVPVYQEAFDYESYMYDLINTQYGQN